MGFISQHIKQYAKIGIALSAEKNINKIFEMIVEEAMLLTSADAGTLYILDKETDLLRFEIVMNNSLNTRLGGTSGKITEIPPVPLSVDGKPNHTNVSSYVALTGKSVNVSDVYNSGTFEFIGPKKYDAQSGYRSKSMLVIPMKNHEDKIIGVLQLLNAQEPDSKKIIPFQTDSEDLIESLASQAAVALNNVQLIKELKLLFYSFIRSIATAIDEKSPFTGGHIRRVAELTTSIAQEINRSDTGPFKDIRFSEDQMEELKISAWMHDVGKITTPEFIVDKMTKLETIYDRIALIETRFKLIAETMKTACLEKKIALMESGGTTSDAIAMLDAEYYDENETLKQELSLVKSCNNTGEFMDDDMLSQLKIISEKTFPVNGKECPYLTPDEYANLCVRKGTLTGTERNKIENHAAMTLKITSQLPFPDHLAGVPQYASAHHEKLDGSGYPLGLDEKDLPLQSRIIGIADIFEALTARDRPYKGPMKLSQAIKILSMMQQNHHIDSDILNLFIQSGLHKEYAEKELSKEQIDV